MSNKASRVVMVSLIVAFAAPVAARAEQPKARVEEPKPRAEEPKARAAEPKAETPPKSALIKEPSLKETGRVAPMGVQAGGVEIQRRSDLAAPKENSIQEASGVADERPLPAPRPGVIDAAVLDRQIKARFAEARECRVEIGRRKQVALGQVSAGTLTLRWTILPTGEVAGTVVVVTTPSDTDLVDCVKRRMGMWTFTRPRGGSVSVERALKFR